MPSDANLPSTHAVSRLGPVGRRRLLLLGGTLAVAAALAACGGDDGGKGSRDDPFPYSDPRSRNTRL